MTDKKDDDTSVRVALRVRPQNAREKIDMCQVCSSVTPGEPQVLLGQDKAFTFDFVFDTETVQQSIYEDCVSSLIEGCFEGYNATVFAYGQTGSGKTYTMGTGFDMNATEEETGIIPRAVEHLFRGIQVRREQALALNMPPPDFKVNAQFMELYNEEILDLLDTTRDPENRGRKSHIKIHEDINGGIYVVGVTTQPVVSLEETLECLKTGSLSRATASTKMNLCSSRSHAIFTLHIKQHRLVKDTSQDGEIDDTASDMTDSLSEFETLTAKFHFVDLAGSERLKRTGAVGERAKEGISINCGLLALGNVISALGDVTKKGCHVPYRDSKLTRLLQDSLGGNSRTLMIACISPSDRDFMETLNTLKYANRARNIKNRIMANQDKASRQLSQLRGEIAALQQELIEYKTGKRVVGADGSEGYSDMHQENSLLQMENDKLRTRIKALHETVETLRMHNANLVAERDSMSKNGYICNEDVSNLIKKYTEEIENLRASLVEAEALCGVLQKQQARSPVSLSSSLAPSSLGMHTPDSLRHSVLEQAKKEIRRMKKAKRSQSRRTSQESDKENISDEEKERNEVLEKEGSEVQEKELATAPEAQNGEVEGAGSEVEKTDREMLDENEETDDLDIEEELSLSESDSEDKDSDNIHEDLAELTCEISIKQKLITELEAAQKQMQAVKHQYEEKVLQLQHRIKETEVERDTILANISQIETMSAEQVKKIKMDYEKKLHDLGMDLKKMQAAKKEHAQLIKNREHYEKQLKTLQHELSEMKKTKVRLMKQIKEEAERNKQSEARQYRELAQLKKEQVRKENTIRNLEKQKQQKDLVLRRKQEEVEALRRKQKPLSSKAAGRVGKYTVPPTVPVAPFSAAPRRRRGRYDFSPKVAKQKWDAIEKNISAMVTKKQTISNMEKEMDMWLKNRDRLTKKLEKLIAKRNKSAANGEKDMEDLDNAIEMMRGQVTVMQDNIGDCQAGIMQIEESKEEGQEVDVSEVVNSCSLEEAHYLLEHFFQLAISKGINLAVKEAEKKELVAKLHQTEVNNTLQQDLLRHMMMDHVEVDMEIDNLMTANDEDEDEDEDNDSPSSSTSTSPAEAMFDSQPPAAPSTVVSLLALPSGAGDAAARKEKARRRTATPEELLFSGIKMEPSPAPLLPVLETPEEEVAGRLPGVEEEAGMGDSALMPPPKAPAKKASALPRMTVTPAASSGAGPSPSLRRKEYTRPSPDPSPILRRKTYLPSDRLSRSSSLEMATSSDTSPPGSPTQARRSQRSVDDNVFSRLTNTQLNSPIPNRGRVVPMSRPITAKGAPVACMHQAEGHSKAVLSVCASEDLLFTGSKDRTAKGWDLNTGKEIMNFTNHPNNVVKVKYVESSHLVFTVSQSFIKVWDIRTKTANCVKTLSSSGLTVDGDVSESKSRQCELSPGEHYIYDIVPSYDGQALYCATGSMVRIWDIRRFSSMGKLSSGTNAAVMVLALDWHNGTNMVITGSKDHYIKVYEVIVDAAGVLSPKYNLVPPHYDGVQSLAVWNRMLFSGSRDMCIKKWDLDTQSLKQHVNSAHKDWVCALDFLPGHDLLVSGCRAGFLKLWNIEDCSPAGEIKAHPSHINAIAANSNAIFTASNDATVGIWKVRTGLDASDSSSDLGEDRLSISSN